MSGAPSPHHFWAKLSMPRGAEVPLTLSLPAHSLDVAVVFRHLAALPAFRRVLEKTSGQILTDIHLDRLAVIVLFHDLGKANSGFQAKADPGSKGHDTAGHVLEGAALLFEEKVRGLWPPSWLDFLERASAWFTSRDEALGQMFLAALSHHGRPLSLRDLDRASNLARWWQATERINPVEGVKQLVETAYREFPRCFSSKEAPLEAPAAFQQRFAGLVMLADWIGSDDRYFPLGREEGRRAIADLGAAAALEKIGLLPKKPLVPPSWSRCFGAAFAPNPLQGAIEELSLDGENRLLLVESDTGSGKTEAALRWFWRLYAAGKVDGLYFALPTRVAARELYRRVLDSVASVFPEATERPSPILLAVPGYVRADGEPAILPYPENRIWDDNATRTRVETVWAAERPKRFLAAPIAVGTVDQAMLSVMRVKHSLLRSVCLDRHLLVVDEVHASDTYMTEILSSLLKGHVSRGGFALLLSATLGESARARYFDMVPLPLAKAVERPYPSITGGGGEIPIPSMGRRKSVHHSWVEALDEVRVFPFLRDALSEGARVLVICNTVGRAVALLRAIEAGGFAPEWLFRFDERVVCPHHGRFAPADREVLDQAVSRRFGKGSSPGPVLLIGTQTLEQSLDIDADFLVTDLAPVDVLLQRIGRLHRHERPRPQGYETPRVLLRVPDRPLHTYLDEEGMLRGPAGLGRVYENGLVLQRTIDVLRGVSRIDIPEENRRLVEEVTHEEALALLPADLWKKHADWLWGPRLIDLRLAGSAVMPEEVFGELHYHDDGRRVHTRLGEGTVVVSLPAPMSSPFGQTITEVLIPWRHLPDDFDRDDPAATQVLTYSGGFAFAVAGRFFQYTRFGLERRKDESAV